MPSKAAARLNSPPISGIDPRNGIKFGAPKPDIAFGYARRQQTFPGRKRGKAFVLGQQTVRERRAASRHAENENGRPYLDFPVGAKKNFVDGEPEPVQRLKQEKKRQEYRKYRQLPQIAQRPWKRRRKNRLSQQTQDPNGRYREHLHGSAREYGSVGALRPLAGSCLNIVGSLKVLGYKTITTLSGRRRRHTPGLVPVQLPTAPASSSSSMRTSSSRA